MKIVLDTETTGIIRNWKNHLDVINIQPEVIELAYFILDSKDCIVKKRNYYIKPMKMSISNKSQDIHGITREYLKDKGKNVKRVLKLLQHDIQDVTTIIGHNILFDIKMVEIECKRNSIHIDFGKLGKICTMKTGMYYTKMPIKNITSIGLITLRSNYKYPKLGELYQQLYDTVPFYLHNAYMDIKYTYLCYIKLKVLGYIKN